MYLAEECLQGAACGCLLIRERHHELLELYVRVCGVRLEPAAKCVYVL